MCFKSISRKFQGSLKEVFKGFKEASRKFSRVFQNYVEISLGVSSEIYKGDLSAFSGSFKDISKKLKKFPEVSRVFQRSLMGV